MCCLSRRLICVRAGQGFGVGGCFGIIVVSRLLGFGLLHTCILFCFTSSVQRVSTRCLFHDTSVHCVVLVWGVCDAAVVTATAPRSAGVVKTIYRLSQYRSDAGEDERSRGEL